VVINRFFDRRGVGQIGEREEHMEITFNTHNADATVALKALNLYKAKQYNEAIPALTEILDYEPGNWDARLLLAACYYRTQQFLTAQRIFRYISDSCPDRLTRLKAVEATNVIASKLDHKSDSLPPEFGSYASRVPGQISWLESA
jgi:thioredoxin-like negative regulator of GroEL